MNRAAIEHMTDLKRMIQSAIDAGEISNRSQLLALAAEQGLTVTRNGRDYAGFMTKSEKRFRVHFDFNDYVPKKPKAARLSSHVTEPEQSDIRVDGPDEITPEQPHKAGAKAVGSQKKMPKARRKARNPTTGFWIYALIAHSKDGRRKACYVGQAARLAKRFREHFNEKREGHCSYALLRWAEHEQVDVQAVVLTWAEGTQSNATYFEGYWLQRALNAGFQAPDVHNWGNLPRPDSLPGQPKLWPTELVQSRSLSLVEVVMQRITPKALYLDAVPTGMVQLGLSLTLHADNAVDRFA
ncbi:GIY-YIG nuclease family protein [Pseudomonas sp. zfem004]|uniref:GIY-YIG nuclease family protein n=2 Tax=Pseudomonas TaxID=286 RepID=A0ABU7GWL7_9PSED|nr:MULTISPECIES: GIY-YIG nuclease family protein [Pseudomonas]MDU9401019.1 GIY-YIG nuclease family protein [Pseudomonas sp. zfem004]MEE1882661.1 GIY-YIG nuclease family protein [Pseudomonas soli]